MATFVFTYRMPPEFTPGKPETLLAWAAWFSDLGDRIIDHGLPTHGATTLGDCGVGSVPSGYSVVEVENLAAAVALAERCPALAEGGGVQVGAAVDLEAGTAPAGGAA
jgi:hypothetical protein